MKIEEMKQFKQKMPTLCMLNTPVKHYSNSILLCYKD